MGIYFTRKIHRGVAGWTGKLVQRTNRTANQQTPRSTDNLRTKGVGKACFPCTFKQRELAVSSIIIFNTNEALPLKVRAKEFRSNPQTRIFGSAIINCLRKQGLGHVPQSLATSALALSVRLFA